MRTFREWLEGTWNNDNLGMRGQSGGMSINDLDNWLKNLDIDDYPENMVLSDALEEAGYPEAAQFRQTIEALKAAEATWRAESPHELLAGSPRWSDNQRNAHNAYIAAIRACNASRAKVIQWLRTKRNS